jgi:seryl-tRNA synthetase
MDDVMKAVTNGGGSSAWARSAVVIIAFGIMLWFDPRIAYMQTQINQNAADIKIMDGQGTRHSSQNEITLSAEVKENSNKLQKLEDRYDKIDNTLTAILNRLPDSVSGRIK